MEHFTPVRSLIGGILIGLSAAILLLWNGRVAGISGILGGALLPFSTREQTSQAAGDMPWRIAFLLGLVTSGVVAGRLWPEAFVPLATNSLAVVVLGGLLVGHGTRMGNGCTSGHGVCGIGRLSPRSIVATMTFMATGALTVAVVRHLIGRAS